MIFVGRSMAICAFIDLCIYKGKAGWIATLFSEKRKTENVCVAREGVFKTEFDLVPER